MKGKNLFIYFVYFLSGVFNAALFRIHEPKEFTLNSFMYELLFIIAMTNHLEKSNFGDESSPKPKELYCPLLRWVFPPQLT